MNKMIPTEIIHADENGNAAIGKNLEIDGTIKVNKGIEPVLIINFELEDSEGSYMCKFIDYGEFINAGYHLLYFSFDDGNSVTLGLGTYATHLHGLTGFDILGVSIADLEFQIVSLPNLDFGTTPTYIHIATRP